MERKIQITVIKITRGQIEGAQRHTVLNLGSVEECHTEEFQSYTTGKVGKPLLLHRQRTQEVSVPRCRMKISSNYARCRGGVLEGFTSLYSGPFYLNISQCESLHKSWTLGLDIETDRHIIKRLDEDQPHQHQLYLHDSNINPTTRDCIAATLLPIWLGPDRPILPWSHRYQFGIADIFWTTTTENKL